MYEELTFDRLAYLILKVFVNEVRNNLWRLTLDDVAYRLAESRVAINGRSLELALQQMIANGNLTFDGVHFSIVSRYGEN